MDDAMLEKVKAYFDGAMSDEERLRFKEELTANKELADIVDLYQTIENGTFNDEVSEEEERLLRNSLKEIQEGYSAKEHAGNLRTVYINREDTTTMNQEPDLPSISGAPNAKTRKLNVWRNLAVAAIVLGVILVSSTWFLQRGKDKPDLATAGNKTGKPKGAVMEDTLHAPVNTPADQAVASGGGKTSEQRKSDSAPELPSTPNREARENLYVRNFTPDALPEDYSDLLEEALSRYKDQEYKDAIAYIDIDAIKTSLEELRPRGQQSDQNVKEEKQTLFYAYYYKALSYMADNKAEKALPMLQKALADSQEKSWRTKVQWYLALACLKTGKIDDARKWLKQIAETNKTGEYQHKAIQLLKQLEGNQAPHTTQ